MKIISFNINGVRARLHQLQALISAHHPDVIGLQEVKVVDEQFPREAIEAMGYHCEFFGQKSHYGVALLSKIAPVRVLKGFPFEPDPSQRRMICGTFVTSDGKPIHVINTYFPQGESRDHQLKFPYKKNFYEHMQRFVDENFSAEDRLALVGDFNISRHDSDIGIGEENRKRWLKQGKCSFLPEEREWLERLCGWGLIDSWRQRNPDVDNCFSWFDYRSAGFEDEPKRGLRIDLILHTPALDSICSEVGIDYELRAMEKPSDHCPIWSTYSIDVVSS